MKTILTALAVFLCLASGAQTAFEGSIHYRLHTDKEKEDAKLRVHFGANRIKLEFLEPRSVTASNYILIMLDSGKIFSIATKSRTYGVRNLPTKAPDRPLPPARPIAGHGTSVSFLEQAGAITIMGNIAAKETVLYTANDLYFPIPEKWGRVAELMVVNQNRIVLGAELTFAERYTNEMMPATDLFVVTAEATSITPKEFGAAEFDLPQGLERQEPYGYSTVSPNDTDSLAIATDTAAIGPTVPLKKEGNKRKKMLPPAKGKAIRRKLP